ncbi:ribonuclease H [Dysgonomonas sp. GY75]|nr:ribonuclease H [Dysgonomonas sp. GY75]
MEIPVAGIATDAAHSVKNRLTGFRGVDLSGNREIFLCYIGNKTVNTGEFLGVIAAVKYILENDCTPVIYTDSTTAVTWYNNMKTASKKTYAELGKAEVFLKIMSERIKHIRVLHWDNNLWGEIPADFGHK